MKNYRWGIIGPGKISRKFAETLHYLPNCSLQAVVSRNLERAKQFGAEFGAVSCYNNIEDLVNDPDVDAVYIGTPHSEHAEQAIVCLNHKKPVLSEKPLALSEKQVQRIVDASVKNNCFLMEAMWTRFLPATLKAASWINEGEIGEVKYVRADFGFEAPFRPEWRLYNMDLGGGSLLDIGIYPLFLVLFLMGEPKTIKATAHLSPSGADESCQAIFDYGDGRIAEITSTLTCETSTSAEIAGPGGIIHIPGRWYRSHYLSLHKKDMDPVNVHLPHDFNGFEYQVREVIQCLENGMVESEGMPHKFSLLMAKMMDAIRLQIGVHYPNED